MAWVRLIRVAFMATVACGFTNHQELRRVSFVRSRSISTVEAPKLSTKAIGVTVPDVDANEVRGEQFLSSDEVSTATELTTEGAEGVLSFEYLAPRGALLAMAAVCGTNFPLLKLLEQSHSEGSVALVRFSLAALPFVACLRCSRGVALAGLEIGAWGAFGYITQAIGLHLTDASKGAFICCLFTVVAPIASGLGFAGPSGKARGISASTWAAVGLALAGTALLEVGGKSDLAAVLSSFNVGDAWCVGAALGFGLMYARMEKHVEEHPGNVLQLTAWQFAVLVFANLCWFAIDDLDAVPNLLALLPHSVTDATATAAASAAGGAAVVAGGGTAVAATTLTAAAAATTTAAATPALGHIGGGGFEALKSWTAPEMTMLAWMGLVTTAAVLWGQTKVQQYVSAAETGIIFSSEPIFASVFATWILNEPPMGPVQIAGALLVLGGCVVSSGASQSPSASSHSSAPSEQCP